MKEEITKTVETLLRDLAVQLGTTTEYLWRVLVAQAPIDATINLIQCLSVIPFWFLLLKWYKWVANHRETIYKNDLEPIHYGGLCISGMALIILSIIALMSIPTVLTGFFSPEYWALEKILTLIKGE